jgi:transcriptional regulator with XRE-family HTH domain
MPRSPAFDHVVRKLRRIIGYTQSKLATELGVSAIAVKRIENGNLALSNQMKKRLMIATGVDPASLDGKTPVFIGESSYTREMFERRRENLRTRKRGDETAELRDWHRVLLRQAAREMDALMDAAVNANKFDMILYLWELWLQQTIKELNLSDRFLKAVEKRGFDSTTAFLLRKRSTQHCPSKRFKSRPRTKHLRWGASKHRRRVSSRRACGKSPTGMLK